MGMRYLNPSDGNCTNSNAVASAMTITNTWQVVHPAGIRVGPQLGRGIRMLIQSTVPAQITTGTVHIYMENASRDVKVILYSADLATLPAIASQQDINFREKWATEIEIPFGYYVSVYVNSATQCVGANNILSLPIWEN